MIEFKGSKVACKMTGCFVGEVQVTQYGDSTELVNMDDWLESWSKSALLEVEWFYYCPICGRDIEEEVTALLAEKGIE